MKILEEGNLYNYFHVYSKRSYIRESLGDFKGALDDYSWYKYYSDSIRNDRNTKELVQQTTRYEYNQQLFADSLEYAKREAIKDLEIAKQDANISKQRIALGVDPDADQ